MNAHHGGKAFEAIGHGLENLDRRASIVPADVLDAWFDPCPGAISIIREATGWLARTAPPDVSLGLAKEIAKSQNLGVDSVLCGAGSSDLIYRAFLTWLSRESRVFVFDPTYSEYRHLCEKVIGCHVDSLSSLEQAEGSYDLIVVVNPNNPTGEVFSQETILKMRSRLRGGGRIWVDEAYLPFVSNGESLQETASGSKDLVVCQSLSKSLALSGMRVGYLVGHPDVLSTLRKKTPPWIVALPAVAATIEAIKDPNYYTERYQETAILRERLACALGGINGFNVVSGSANWLSCQSERSSQEVIDSCEQCGVLLRNGDGMFMNAPAGFVRIAVRSADENAKILDALALAHASVACV